jgi:penicillin-binding protein-related factor A (putative recombinase)
MLINAQDPHQWTYLRNLPQKKKKKTLVLTNVGKALSLVLASTLAHYYVITHKDPIAGGTAQKTHTAKQRKTVQITWFTHWGKEVLLHL